MVSLTVPLSPLKSITVRSYNALISSLEPRSGLKRSLLSEEPRASSLSICFWIVAVPIGLCSCSKQMVFTVHLLFPI